MRGRDASTAEHTRSMSWRSSYAISFRNLAHMLLPRSPSFSTMSSLSPLLHACDDFEECIALRTKLQTLLKLADTTAAQEAFVQTSVASGSDRRRVAQKLDLLLAKQQSAKVELLNNPAARQQNQQQQEISQLGQMQQLLEQKKRGGTAVQAEKQYVDNLRARHTQQESPAERTLR